MGFSSAIPARRTNLGWRHEGTSAAAACSRRGEPQPDHRGRMKLVVFGLTVSSSWGNGHATLWRGLISALAERGVTVEFFERDVDYYAGHRNLWELPGGRTLHLYTSWEEA